jgi:streptomycin 6-kinase
LVIPERLVDACRGSRHRTRWLERLPDAILTLLDRWRLSLGEPFDGSEGSCAWVAPVARETGERAVLKLGMPHMEAAHELHGLRFWDGDPTVRLLEADVDLNAMLMEACDSSVTLRSLPALEQDVIIARLLRRLWRRPTPPHPFRPLAGMAAHWAAETSEAATWWPDAALVRDGLKLFDELSRPSPDDVLLATDLHAGNVLGAQREPWLVIDPKPFVGDRTYDATQHLLNCRDRVLSDPGTVIRQFADLLDIDAERLRLWMFARAAAEPRDIWSDDSLTLARALLKSP